MMNQPADTAPTISSPPSSPPSGSAWEVFITFLKLGLTSFGGPVAHLGYFHKELVEKRRWLDDALYAQLLAVCQFLPGPASSQLGFALGLTRAGWLGAISAFVAFTMPSALLLFVFAMLIGEVQSDGLSVVVDGLKLVAVVIVADAVWGMWQKLCDGRLTRVVAIIVAVSFLLMAVLGYASPVWQIAAIVLAGLLGVWLRPEIPSSVTAAEGLRLRYGRRLGVVFLLLFLGLLLLTLPDVRQPAAVAMAQDFYQAGALVFGGGHVVLPLLEANTVGAGVVSADDFLAGYGAAQAVPGPLFTFAAYLGALLPAGSTPELQALIAIIAVFLPGFLLLLGVLPFWVQLSRYAAVRHALVTVSAAVVGLLLATLVTPVASSAVSDLTDVLIVVLGFALLRGWGAAVGLPALRLSPLTLVLWCVVLTLVSAQLSLL